jgi:peptidoglycan-N-acetylglucosamine deacetylase
MRNRSLVRYYLVTALDSTKQFQYNLPVVWTTETVTLSRLPAALGRRDAWLPAPVISLSIGMHGLAVVGTVAQPGIWAWTLGGLVANHMALGCLGMWPRSQMLGPNVVRLPRRAIGRNEIALTFDDGPDPAVTPVLLDILDRYSAQASFFCIGERAAAHPDLVRETARRGHNVENHSYTHPNGFALYPPAWLVRELRHTQEAITRITGRAPEFFRPPMGLRSPLLDPVLKCLGLRHVSWTRRGHDAVNGNPTAALSRLTRRLAPGDVLMLHDGNCARARNNRPVVLEVLPVLLERMASQGLRSVSLSQALC